MCGIAGIIGLQSDSSKPLINKMVDAIKHRGPDAEGVFVEDNCALGQSRLSIIDLSSSANQPFYDNSNQYVIVFNGEIYNYMEVRKKLDYQWKTSSDTEVVLAAYIKLGADCLEHLNGMFAFAIWNKQSEELFIARDRVGVKPLYYYHLNQTFIFSSEIRSILISNLVERCIDNQSLYQYLGNMAVKTPKTLIKNIFQLCPGECATFKNGELKKSYYWTMAKSQVNNSIQLSYAETKDRTFQLFDSSIKSRMVADVKVGAFLSGGIDSSAVVALMAQHSTSPIETFSIVFDDKDFDESKYSRLIAAKYATKHTEFKLDPEELLKELPAFIANMDSPTVDGINTYMVSKLVANTGIKVVLTGIGGDELFVGYRNFIRWKSFNSVKTFIKNPISKLIINVISKFYNHRVLSKIKDFQNIKGSSISSFYYNSRSIFLKNELHQLFRNTNDLNINNWLNLDNQNIKKMPIFSQYSVAELTNYTLDVLLKDTDQMSMAWALEVREPFFDYHLIEFLLSVPDKYKYKANSPKHLLVDAMGDSLPKEIVNRPKKGFSFPWDKWLRNELKGYCEQSILQLSTRGIFNSDYLLGLWKRFLENDKSITWVHIWSFVVLEKWMVENKIES